jgi:hypothetical protein
LHRFGRIGRVYVQRRWAFRRGALLQRGKSTGNLPDIEFTGLRSESDEAQ